MTVAFTTPRPTDSLICQNQTKFFPTRIPSQHHQLKNYISTRHGDHLYYAADYDIYSLHLATKDRRLVKSLKWKPFCLDAAHDWICVGGQNKGQCAFIHIIRDENNEATPFVPNIQHSEVDDLLPLDLDPESRALIHPGSSTLRVPSFRPPKYEVHEHNFGDDIVNSVVLQRLPAGREGLEDQVVAILTNNDRTVLIYSLTTLDLLEAPGPFPTAMNHATISPDGNLLIAVGDLPQAFFSRRVFTQALRKAKPCWTYEWQSICEPKLSLAHKEDCCFTTGFSPSGHICAAASQAGVTTIFNTSLITEDMDAELAVIGVLRSSRLNVSSYRGAIRSMSFSPGPWDLLALAEDQGRVSVVDLRNEFQSEQTIKIDANSPKLVRLEIHDVESTLEQRQSEIERRFLDSHDEAIAARDHLAAVTNTADYIQYTAERRRREREDLNNELQALRSDPHRLTESERQMIDALGLRRARSTNVDPPTPISVNYSSNTNRFDPPTPPWRGSNVPSTAPGRQSASIAEYMRQPNSERSRHTTERTYQPRRRSSVVISNSNATSSPNPTNLAPIGTATPTLSASPSRLTSTTNADPTLSSLEEPWHTITAAMGTNGDAVARMRRIDAAAAHVRNTDRRIQTPTGADLISQSQQLQALQQLAARNEQQQQFNVLNAQRLNLLRSRHPRIQDDEDDGMVLGDVPGRPDSEDGITTMGVGWSPDGRYLYVATEEGIFEFSVNIEERQRFPGMAWI